MPVARSGQAPKHREDTRWIRRTFVKGSAAVVGAATLPTVYAQAQAAPDKIRFGYAITLSGPLGAGRGIDEPSRSTSSGRSA